MVEKFLSRSRENTINFAAKFARTLKKGDIVLLDGDLGAGKTVFSKGVVEELSAGKLSANSPSFVILNIYDCNPKVYHFDLYRIEDVSELYAIGAEEYLFSGEGISLVEWPTRASDFFGKFFIKVYIEKINDNERNIIVER